VKAGELPGVLAYAGAEPVGWVAVEPRARYARLAISRNLPVVDQRPTWSIPCFFVARGWRGQGLSARLLAAAAAHARTRGAPAVEGYPIDSKRPLAGPWLYPGAFSTFVEAGFTEVARKARTRPVMKLELRRRSAKAPRRVGRQAPDQQEVSPARRQPGQQGGQALRWRNLGEAPGSSRPSGR
jgi:GNAT superfamily N-acetyltransferase